MTADSAKILAGIGSTTAIGSLAYFAPADTAGPVAVAYTAEVQTATITGTATALGFTWKGLAVPSQSGSVATAALQTAANTAWASQLHGGTVTVSGSAGTSYVFTFPAALGNVPTITATATGATIAVVKTTPGVGATTATAVIPAGFLDAGYCSTDGLAANVAETVNSIKGFGNINTLRIIIQDSSRSFDVTFLEANPVSLCVYNRLPLGTIVPDSNGAFNFAIGAPQTQTYAGIFNLADGNNFIRGYAPRLQVSSVKGNAWAAGKEITSPVSMTALPDTTGQSIYWSYVVDALHA